MCRFLNGILDRLISELVGHSYWGNCVVWSCRGRWIPEPLSGGGSVIVSLSLGCGGHFNHVVIILVICSWCLMMKGWWMGWWVLMLASAGAVSMDEMGHGCCGDPAHLGYAGCEQGGLWHAIIHVRCPPYRAQNPSMLLPSSVQVITWCPHPSMRGGPAGCQLGAWHGTRLGDVVVVSAWKSSPVRLFDAYRC